MRAVRAGPQACPARSGSRVRAAVCGLKQRPADLPAWQRLAQFTPGQNCDSKAAQPSGNTHKFQKEKKTILTIGTDAERKASGNPTASPKKEHDNKFDQMVKQHITWRAGCPRPLLTGLM